MDLDYQTPKQPATTKHDHVYTTLLGVLAFFFILGICTLIWLRLQPNTASAARSAYLLPLMVEICYCVAITAVLCIRIFAPGIRRWPTFALNIILVVWIPFGTALAIYGFWKVDKRVP
jgi:hypothetical protein